MLSAAEAGAKQSSYSVPVHKQSSQTYNQLPDCSWIAASPGEPGSS